MTNIEYIRGVLGVNYPLDDTFFESILVGKGINPTDEYVAGIKFDTALIDSLWLMIASAKRISEGGYTVEIDTNALLKVISWLYNKNGLRDLTKDGYASGYPTKLW